MEVTRRQGIDGMGRNKSFLVTGGAGFLGSHLVLKLLRAGHEVAIFDHAPEKSPFYDHPGVKIIDEDTRSFNAFEDFIEDYDVIVHLAGHIDVRESVEKPYGDADNNIMGTINVLDACRKHNKIAIYSSSASVYGDRSSLPLKEDGPTVPVSPYGQSKLTAEQYFQLYNKLYGVKTVSLRILNVAGPLKFKGVFYNFANALVNDKPITIYGDGEQSRDFVCVGDVVDALMKSTQTKKWGEIYNIGTGNPTSVNKLLSFFREHSTGSNNVLYKSALKGEIWTSYADISKAKHYLDWKPKGSLRYLREEVGRIMEWAKNGLDVQAWRDMHGI
jgi:UDP-glucose 4-epimerase